MSTATADKPKRLKDDSGMIAAITDTTPRTGGVINFNLTFSKSDILKAGEDAIVAENLSEILQVLQSRYPAADPALTNLFVMGSRDLTVKRDEQPEGATYHHLQHVHDAVRMDAPQHHIPTGNLNSYQPRVAVYPQGIYTGHDLQELTALVQKHGPIPVHADGDFEDLIQKSDLLYFQEKHFHPGPIPYVGINPKHAEQKARRKAKMHKQRIEKSQLSSTEIEPMLVALQAVMKGWPDAYSGGTHHFQPSPHVYSPSMAHQSKGLYQPNAVVDWVCSWTDLFLVTPDQENGGYGGCDHPAQPYIFGMVPWLRAELLKFLPYLSTMQKNLDNGVLKTNQARSYFQRDLTKARLGILSLIRRLERARPARHQISPPEISKDSDHVNEEASSC